MPRSAATVRVLFEAGTEGFVADVKKAEASVRQFGTASKVSSAESNAAVKLLEGNIGSSTRAVSRFLSQTLGLGPILSAAFPVVGLVLFGKAIADTGIKVYEFFRNMKFEAEQTRQAFRSLTDPLRTTTDQIRLETARIENEIAALEGRRQNTLKEALMEAVVAADKLAESLDNDLKQLNKLMQERAISEFNAMFTGRASTRPAEDRLRKFSTDIEQMNQFGLAAARASKSFDEAQAAQAVWQGRIITALDIEIAKQRELVDVSQKTQDIYTGKTAAPTTPSGAARGGVSRVVGRDVGDLLATQQEELSNLEAVRDRVAATLENLQAKVKKTQVEGEKNFAKIMEPFNKAVDEGLAKIEGLRGEIKAIGQGPEAAAMAKGALMADEAIAKINDEMGRLSNKQKQLTPNQEAIIRGILGTEALSEEEKAHKTALDATIKSIENQIRVQEMLTAAVGKGAAAVRAAQVEARVFEAQKGAYGTPGSEPEAARIRDAANRDLIAQQNDKTANAVLGLQMQIEQEHLLAKAQELGIEEIEKVNRVMILRRGLALGTMPELIQLELDLYNAQKDNADARSLTKINAEVAGEERLTAAILKGAEAVRLQRLENERLENIRTKGPEEAQATLILETVRHQNELTQEALKTGMEYKNHIESLLQQIAILRQILILNKGNLEATIALKKANDELLHTLAEQKLQIGTLKAGMEAFFLDMQREAKKPGQILYESMNSAVDKLSDQLAKLFTGQKTSFKKMVQGLGEEMTKESIKSGLQKGLGALGIKLGIRDGQTQRAAIWVQLVGSLGPAGATAATDAITGNGGHGTIFGGRTNNPLIWNFGGADAEGGDTGPGSAYWVGEKGPELFVPGQSGSIMSSAMSSRAIRGQGALYVIDARGTDPAAVDRNVRAALAAVHGSAVSTSLQAQQDRTRRVVAG